MGELHDSRTGFYRLLPPFSRPIGEEAPASEAVSSTAVQRHEKDPDYAPDNLDDYLDGDPRVTDVEAKPLALPRR